MAPSAGLGPETPGESVVGLPPTDALGGFWCEVAAGLPGLVLVLGLLLLARMVRSVRSRIRARREHQLTRELAAEVRRKCELLDRLSVAQDTYAGVQEACDLQQLERNMTGLTDAFARLVQTSSDLVYDVQSLALELEEMDDSEGEDTGPEDAEDTEPWSELESLQEAVTAARRLFPWLRAERAASSAGAV